MDVPFQANTGEQYVDRLTAIEKGKRLGDGAC